MAMASGRGAALLWARGAAHAHWDFNEMLLSRAPSIGGGTQ
jgi:hypothetical protein